MSSALTALPSCLQNCRIKIMQWRVWLISQGIRISENYWLEEYMVWWSSFRYGQCKTQTADYCFHHANDNMTTIVPFVFNPKNNIPQSCSLQVCILHCPNQRFIPFFERTFQGLSRTHFPLFKDSIQCKKESWVYVFFSSSTTSAISTWRSSVFAPFPLGWIKLALKFKDFPAPTAIFKDLQGLEFLFPNSRTFKDYQGACEPGK